jgi:hypothetical protein
MTHSILNIVIAVLISMLILGFEHYIPWKRWLGTELSRPAAYTLGVLGIILPQIGLWAVWAAFPPVGNPFVWCIASLGAGVIASGLMVYALYLIDGKHDAEVTARAARLSEAVWREEK